MLGVARSEIHFEAGDRLLPFLLEVDELLIFFVRLADDLTL